ncbi:unnamed protein product [Fusarium graminearum]|nr:unnamed protein product [Fusarium graminearum]
MPRVNIGPFHLNRDDTTKLANKPFRRNIDAFLEAQALDTNLEKALKAEIEAISGTCCQGCLVGNRKLNSNIRIDMRCTGHHEPIACSCKLRVYSVFSDLCGNRLSCISTPSRNYL